MKCSDCPMCHYNNYKSCELGHNFERFETNCPDFKPIDLRANIPEEDQIQKKEIKQAAEFWTDRAAEQICDNYCKFPELIKNEDILHKICEGCPLNILMTIQGGSKNVK